MIRYENSKTKSLLNIPEDDIRIGEIDDWAYIMKMMIYNDQRIIRNRMQDLVNCLVQVKEKKVSR